MFVTLQNPHVGPMPFRKNGRRSTRRCSTPRCVMPTTAQPSTNFRRLSRSSVTVDFPVGVTLNPLWDGVRRPMEHGLDEYLSGDQIL